MWEIEEALALIRRIQPALKPLGYHVCLGGGVLNHGGSMKDLDLFFVPLTNDKAPALNSLWAFIFSKDGIGPLRTNDDGSPISHKPNPYTPFRGQDTVSALPLHKRVDIFIV